MNVEKGILRPKIGYLKKKQAYPPECPVLKSRSSVGDACLGLGASKIGINRQLLSDLLYKVKPVLSSVHPQILIRHTPWNPEARQRHQKQSHTLHQTQCSQASADHLHLWNNDTDILRRPRSDHSHPVEAERCILCLLSRRCLRWHILRCCHHPGSESR